MLTGEEKRAVGISGGWLTYSRSLSIRTNKRTSTSTKYSVLPINKTGKTAAYWDIDQWYDDTNGNIAPAYFEIADLNAVKCEEGTISISAQWFLFIGPRPTFSVQDDPSLNTSERITGTHDGQHMPLRDGWLGVGGGFSSSIGISVTIRLQNTSYRGEISTKENWSQSLINRTKDVANQRRGSTILIPGVF